MNAGAMRRLEQLLPGLEYDICAMTGDYRRATFGPFDDALEGMKRIAVPIAFGVAPHSKYFFTSVHRRLPRDGANQRPLRTN
jgi:hypothetical protein